MKACIHRGATQIGGSCVELVYEGQRLLVDLGLPLDADDASEIRMPASLDITGGQLENSMLTVVLSHPHMDHYGLMQHLPEGTQICTGQAARSIIRAATPFTGQPEVNLEGLNLVDRETLEIGSFKITPFLVDHSAYDAYSLLIEAGGRRVFYSGDFRGHGRKAALFEKMLQQSPTPIHALLMEGTSIGRPDSEDFLYPTEHMLEEQMTIAFKNTTGLMMVHTSAQNIDRVVTMFRAARKTGRVLVIDLYTAAILEATGNANLPQSSWDGVALYIPQRQRIQIKKGGWFDLLGRHKQRRIYAENIAENPEKYALLFRPLHMKDLSDAGCLVGSGFIYSQWQGYWDSGSYDKVKEWLSLHGIPLHNIHTSGHADPTSLKRFVGALAPDRLVPIHSFHPEKFTWLYPEVESHVDGEWWYV